MLALQNLSEQSNGHGRLWMSRSYMVVKLPNPNGTLSLYLEMYPCLSNGHFTLHGMTIDLSKVGN